MDPVLKEPEGWSKMNREFIKIHGATRASLLIKQWKVAPSFVLIVLHVPQRGGLGEAEQGRADGGPRLHTAVVCEADRSRTQAYH